MGFEEIPDRGRAPKLLFLQRFIQIFGKFANWRETEREFKEKQDRKWEITVLTECEEKCKISRIPVSGCFGFFVHLRLRLRLRLTSVTQHWPPLVLPLPYMHDCLHLHLK